MSSEKPESSEEVNKTFQWYLEKPEIKEATPTKDFLQLPKLRWNPFTYSFSVGLAGAVASLSYGLHCTLKDKTDMIQKMMEARVAFQTVAVVSLVCGMLYWNRECEKMKARRPE